MADAMATKSVTSSENGSKKMKCETGEGGMIRGTVVLQKKKPTDFTSFASTVRDMGRGLVDKLTGHELVGKDVSLQFISAVNADPVLWGQQIDFSFRDGFWESRGGTMEAHRICSEEGLRKP